MRTITCPKCNEVVAVPDNQNYVICCNEVIYVPDETHNNKDETTSGVSQ
jgi:phage FluMu protein Com